VTNSEGQKLEEHFIAFHGGLQTKREKAHSRSFNGGLHQFLECVEVTKLSSLYSHKRALFNLEFVTDFFERVCMKILFRW
jgi:hypothetical protein